ncbi:hypothetical protein [Streptomyces sp. NPDC052701]|uniref:hypothetical protein n=1 Tax=Streptomyces sp. NPDC052701 TaxID=3155533 RepID=UPI00344A6791
MSGPDAPDRPGTPHGARAWDERPQEWPAGEPDASASGPHAATGVEDVPVSGPGVATGGRDLPAGGRDAPGARLAGARDDGAPGAARTAAARRPPAPRRGAADPVKALMHRHRELCERAVDPLEIAAGLEAHGFTDRTAARFRHRDVFSLAEEMYARACGDGDTGPRPVPAPVPTARADWVALTLLPGALCAATVAALHLTDGRTRLVAVAAGVLAVALAVRTALRRGPLGTNDRTSPGPSSSWTYWFLGYALLGDGLLRAAVTGGPDGPPTGGPGGPWPVTTAPVLALALACAPAAWTARLFAVRARRRLTASRGLEEFAGTVRPLLLGTFALFLCALAALLALCAAILDEPAAHLQTLALGALLFLARLLAVHRFTHAPAVVLAATATAQAAAVATVFVSRLPGCAFLAAPVDTLVTTWGPGSLSALTCGAAALTLLVHAARTLTRASAHAPAERPC